LINAAALGVNSSVLLHRARPSRGTLPSVPRACKPRATVIEIFRREHGAPNAGAEDGQKKPR
jgi:hypothetical protein